jgi:hypothetical protein
MDTVQLILMVDAYIGHFTAMFAKCEAAINNSLEGHYYKSFYYVYLYKLIRTPMGFTSFIFTHTHLFFLHTHIGDICSWNPGNASGLMSVPINTIRESATLSGDEHQNRRPENQSAPAGTFDKNRHSHPFNLNL